MDEKAQMDPEIIKGLFEQGVCNEYRTLTPLTNFAADGNRNSS